MIRVALVANDPKLVTELCAIMTSTPADFCILVFTTGEEALVGIPQEPVDVVLIDLDLPGQDGICTLRDLKWKCPALEVLILTSSTEKQLLFATLKAGASGYLCKQTAPEKIIESIRDLFRGGAPMSSENTRHLVESFQQANHGLSSLSPREQEVLLLLVQGCFYKEIAENLEVSINTVRTFIRRLYLKLKVQSRSAAIVKYYEG